MESRVIAKHDRIAGQVAEPWRDDAACREHDPEMFFSEHPADEVRAQRVCYSCPVMADCLQYALDRRERHGVWGGTTEVERARLRRMLRAERVTA